MAVIDTGLWWGEEAISRNAMNEYRVLAQFDAITNQFVDHKTFAFDNVQLSSPDRLGFNDDDSGHGTHIASIALNSDTNGKDFIGIAPGANLVAVKAFNGQGSGTYLDVIRDVGRPGAVPRSRHGRLRQQAGGHR